MSKKLRLDKIKQIITEYDVDKQEDIVDYLNEAGFQVTQATVSRDIKELGLIKLLTEDKKYKYAIPDMTEERLSSRFINVFKESVISIESANNIIVIKTIVGSANSACAMLDKLNMKEVLGAVAGDDTIIIVVKSNHEVNNVINKLKSI
ncbi:MAG: arginine repressor [Clostridia bacterium]